MVLIPKSVFTNSNNVRYTKSLFYELVDADKSSVVYTLKKEDHLGFPSLYRLFIEEGLLDPTEYTFSQKYMKDWDHWQQIATAPWMIPHLTAWRAELATKLEADYIARIADIAASNDKNSFLALKYLLERTGKAAYASKVGRPRKATTKHEIERTASLERSEALAVDDHFKRILGNG